MRETGSFPLSIHIGDLITDCVVNDRIRTDYTALEPLASIWSLKLRLHWRSFIAHVLLRKKFAKMDIFDAFSASRRVCRKADMPVFPLGKCVNVNARRRNFGICALVECAYEVTYILNRFNIG